MVNSFNTALSRITSYYNLPPDQGNVVSTFGALIAHTQDYDRLIEQLETITSIDKSVGVQLDNIGVLLGQSRIVSAVIPIRYFGWFRGDSDTSTLGWGSIRDANVGGYWPALNSPDFIEQTNLPDDIYRRVLKTRVVHNQYNGTIGDVVKACLLLLGRPLHDTRRVRINDPGTELPYFGWAEDANSKGWGSINDAGVGGYWSDLNSLPVINGDVLIEVYGVPDSDELTRGLFTRLDLIPRPAATTIQYKFYQGFA